MSTGCITVICDNSDEEIAVLFRHGDGYPEVHGVELAKFLSTRILCSGIGGKIIDGKQWANGMNCLAAQIVAHFKDAPGGFYLYPARSRYIGEMYIYEVFCEGPGHNFNIRISDRNSVIFNGTPEELLEKFAEKD